MANPKYCSLHNECLRKKAYRTKEQALISAKLQKRIDKIDLHCYICRFCGHYHLAKKVKIKNRVF